MTTGPRDPTAAKWALVKEARPELEELVKGLRRRCPGAELGELLALAEDAFARRLPSLLETFEPGRGVTLVAYGRRRIAFDVVRGFYRAADHPSLAAGLNAAERFADALAASRAPGDATPPGADGEEHLAASAIGEGAMTAWEIAASGVEEADTGTDPEAEFLAAERAAAVRAAVTDAGEEVEKLVDLLYRQDLTWDQAAAELGIHPNTARRKHADALVRIRALYEGRVRGRRGGAA
jgi:DNA-directed RNA polymerase specialized sigma24 family protein